MGPTTGDPLAAIDDLAGQIAARGVKRIAGDIIGDDTWYVWQPYAVGWAIDDPQSDDGPPISALTDQRQHLRSASCRGARVGDLGGGDDRPAARVLPASTTGCGPSRRTPTERGVQISRIPGTRDVRLWGDRADPRPDAGFPDVDRGSGAVRRAWRCGGRWRTAGIAVDGARRRRRTCIQTRSPTCAGPAPPAGRRRTGEARLRAAARRPADHRQGQPEPACRTRRCARSAGRAATSGSFEAGFEEMKTFLAEAGIAPEAYNFRDGSGLSRLNLVTPSAVVKLLRYM